MDVFQAAETVRKHLLTSLSNSTTQQSSGIVAIKGEVILHFGSEHEAIALVSGSGYIFKYLYRNGQVEITPVA